MNYKKLRVQHLSKDEQRAIAGELALVDRLSITLTRDKNIILGMRYIDDLELLVERCQDVVEKPLEVRMDYV